MKNYDVIVIGTGSMGCVACYYLALEGHKVLGLDQFDPPHEMGSHAGQSRIIRKAYFEHPDYVPLLERAYHNWQKLQEKTGEQVYYKTGLLYHGPPDHEMIRGVKDSATLYSINIQPMSRQEVIKKYSSFSLPDFFETIYESEAGFIRPEKAISLYKSEAIKNGADIHTTENVLQWRKENNSIKVISDKSTYYAKKLIITAGAWTGKIIPQLSSIIQITRQVVIWVQPSNEKKFSPGNFPCWLIADTSRKGAFYGFPYLTKEEFGEPPGLKFAWHCPGEKTDADHVNREIKNEEIDSLVKQLAVYIPDISGATVTAAKTCLYANTPDENFIIDHWPGYDGDVCIACGFSGHGFKFIPVIGEILKDLTMKGKTDLPIDFLKLNRFQSAF